VINIPTELLRTLTAVVDLRSFTRAAQSLGVTQPAVSAQIKRLQWLLGIEIFDKSAPGVTLTLAGELVVNYARRMLSINDQILDLTDARPSSPLLRIGMTGDYAANAVASALVRIRREQKDLRFHFISRPLDMLMQNLRESEIDVVIGLSAGGPPPDAHRSWTEDVSWVQAADAAFDMTAPVPLVSYGEHCAFHRAAIAALNRAGRDSESVLLASTIAGIVSALSAGLGVTTLPTGHIHWPGIAVSRNPLLPKPADVVCGIYLREGGGRAFRESVADALEDALRPPDSAPVIAAASSGNTRIA
jgi:DNA-binding transcriptional LysR family regulator